jgi:hypothetical protein
MSPRLNSFGSFLSKANRKVQWIDTPRDNQGAAHASWQFESKLAGSDYPTKSAASPK